MDNLSANPANPSTPPVSPANEIVDPVQSWIAQHEQRNTAGKFTSANRSSIPPLSAVALAKEDNPPFLSNLWNKLSKLSLKKITTILAFVSLIATNGISLTVIELFFPNSSPIFHRQIAHQGVLKTLGNGQYSLMLPDQSVYTLYLKPSPTLNSLKNLNEVVVKGNLTATPYVIENAEIYPLNITTPNTLASNLSDSPTPPNSPNTPNFPKLFSGIPWDLEEEKVLVFTSGKRRVDMPGVHLESVTVKDFPQDFVDYYNKELKALDFTQTLNSKDADTLGLFH